MGRRESAVCDDICVCIVGLPFMDGADAFGGAGKFQQGLRNGRSLSAVLPHQQQPQVSQSRQVSQYVHVYLGVTAAGHVLALQRVLT